MTVKELIEKLTPFLNNINNISGLDDNLIIEEQYSIVHIYAIKKGQCDNCGNIVDYEELN